MKYSYCLGIRLDMNYQEQTCKIREGCPFYSRNDLDKILSNPEQYQELETYNSEECKYYKKINR